MKLYTQEEYEALNEAVYTDGKGNYSEEPKEGYHKISDAKYARWHLNKTNVRVFGPKYAHDDVRHKIQSVRYDPKSTISSKLRAEKLLRNDVFSPNNGNGLVSDDERDLDHVKKFIVDDVPDGSYKYKGHEIATIGKASKADKTALAAYKHSVGTGKSPEKAQKIADRAWDASMKTQIKAKSKEADPELDKFLLADEIASKRHEPHSKNESANILDTAMTLVEAGEIESAQILLTRLNESDE